VKGKNQNKETQLKKNVTEKIMTFQKEATVYIKREKELKKVKKKKWGSA